MDPDAPEQSAPVPTEDAPPAVEPTPVEAPVPDVPPEPVTAPEPEAAQAPAEAEPVQEDDEPVPAPTAQTSVVPDQSTPVPPETMPVIAHQTAAPKSPADMKTLADLGLAKRRGNKDAKLSRILAYAEKKGHFTIRDIELHLLVPKRTAEEYLEELVAQGRLARHGDVDSTEYLWVE